jgi:hypothetical protein
MYKDNRRRIVIRIISGGFNKNHLIQYLLTTVLCI